MTIPIQCVRCGAFLRARDQKAGQVGRCPVCRTSVAVPSPATARDGIETAIRSERTADPTSPKWFLSLDGSSQGPFTIGELQELAARGRLGPADHVWKEGGTDWTAAGDHPELFSLPRAFPIACPVDSPPSPHSPTRSVSAAWSHARRLAKEHGLGRAIDTFVPCFWPERRHILISPIFPVLYGLVQAKGLDVQAIPTFLALTAIWIALGSAIVFLVPRLSPRLGS